MLGGHEPPLQAHEHEVLKVKVMEHSFDLVGSLVLHRLMKHNIVQALKQSCLYERSFLPRTQPASMQKTDAAVYRVAQD